MDQIASGESPAEKAKNSRLSYKFQRLRERLRQAIASGELSGKLPGERQLSRRFRVNAKTLSKALTDLAAEGLLERSIGRGTFVKGQQPETTAAPQAEKWMLICDPAQVDSPLVQAIAQANPAAHIVTDVSAMRPSFINQYKAVVDFAGNTPETILRDLIVRNISLVVVGREPRMYSSNAVLVDAALAVSQIARDLLISGHSKFFAVEARGQTVVADAIRMASQRYSSGAVVDSGSPRDVAAAIEHGVTAFICGDEYCADQVHRQLEQLNIEMPGRVSLAAVGTIGERVPCSGYFVHVQQMADTILQILRDKSVHRPVTFWLAGNYTDARTTGAHTAELLERMAIHPTMGTISA
jgi:DNA-binding transcriptional regulator YhcF (GntR family)